MIFERTIIQFLHKPYSIYVRMVLDCRTALFRASWHPPVFSTPTPSPPPLPCEVRMSVLRSGKMLLVPQPRLRDLKKTEPSEPQSMFWIVGSVTGGHGILRGDHIIGPARVLL